MSSETQNLRLHRLRNQKRARPRLGVNGHGMRTVINGGDIVCPRGSTSMSGETQSLRERAKASESNHRVRSHHVI
jgi:hypothetical protein